MPNMIFISYSRNDVDLRFARLLEQNLKNHNLTVWRDEEDIIPGLQWPKKINEALGKSTTVLVVLSSRSVKSDWVNKEIDRAVTLEKVIIPILLDDVSHHQLDNTHHVDFRQASFDPFEYENKFQKLLAALKPKPSLAKSTGLRPIPNLFIKNIFAIPHENRRRDDRMMEILRKPVKELCLLARTGFNYLHPSGENFQCGIGAHLGSGTKIKVLLENPYSQVAKLHRQASGGEKPWEKLSPERLAWLIDKYKNLKIRFTDNPVYCSLFFTRESVIYDPYHLGKIGKAARVGNQFLVFEFEKPPNKYIRGAHDYYSLLEDHFNFLWDNQTKTFKQLCAEYPKRLGRIIHA